MRKCRFFISLALSIALVAIGFTTCKNPAGQSGGTLTGLEISSPEDTEYTAGQFFDKTDLVVRATYSNKAPEDVTDQCSFEPDLDTPLSTAHTAIVISYTEDGFTLKANHGITVNPAAAGGLAVTGVTISPAEVQVQRGTSFTFNAVVSGANAPQAVTWMVSGGGAGTTIINGFLTVAAGETASTLTVRAASAVPGYTSIFGTATVNVTDEVVGGQTVVTVSGVTVSPASAIIAKDGTQQFSATVTGDNSPSQTVTWTLEGANAAGTSINTGGLLSVAAGETATTLIVKATSTVVGYTNIFGTAIVTVASPPAVGEVVVVPAAVTVRRGETFQFSATIAGIPSTDVTWSIPDNPWAIPDLANTTNISVDGLLSVWAGDGSTSFTVKATSKANPEMYGTATVTLTF